MRADIVVGGVFPDYELTDHTEKRRKLSDLQGPDPMILVLSRGGYCPKDQRQAQGLVQLYREMEVGYSRRLVGSDQSTGRGQKGCSGFGNFESKIWARVESPCAPSFARSSRTIAPSLGARAELGYALY
jgi:hypothetical protein